MQEITEIQAVRRSNFLAVSEFFRRHRTATIPQIAEEVGLSLPTVTRAINSGIALKVFTSVGICDSDRGRKAVAYSINPDFMHCGVLYFFSDTLHFEVFNFQFERLFERSFDINNDNVMEILDYVVATSMEKDAGIGFYVFGVPGSVHDNVIVESYRFPSLEGIDLLEHFSEMTGKPILIENNMRAAVNGAKEYMPDFDSKTVVAYTYGLKKYGVGISIDGKLCPGACGRAGDIGEIYNIPHDMPNLEFFANQLKAVIAVLDPDRIMLYPTDDDCTFDMMADKMAEHFGEGIRRHLIRDKDLYDDCLNGLLWIFYDEIKTTFG